MDKSKYPKKNGSDEFKRQLERMERRKKFVTETRLKLFKESIGEAFEVIGTGARDILSSIEEKTGCAHGASGRQYSLNQIRIVKD